MASMQYRYSRGQTGQGSLPRPAWGSGGSHGTRATSPEPGGSSAAPLTNGSEGAKERLASTPQDEVILQLEHELAELRNACAVKDQRIAELSRTDVPVGRLKRDIRMLTSELHSARKQLSDFQELQAQQGRSEAGSTGRDSSAVPLARDVVDSPSAALAGDPLASGAGGARGGAGGADRGSDRSLRESIAQLQDENRQLKETVARLQMAPAHDALHHTRQPSASGASTQRSSETPQPLPVVGAGQGLVAGGYRSSDPGPAPPRGGYMGQGPGQPLAGGSGQAPGAQAPVVQQEEPAIQVVYSTHHTENTATIGPTTLQGIGTVDGVSNIAKVLLSRIHSSVCSRRPASQPTGAPYAQPPMQPGAQMPMVMVGMPQGM